MLPSQIGVAVVDEPRRGDGVGLLLGIGCARGEGTCSWTSASCICSRRVGMPAASSFRIGRAVVGRAASGRLRPPMRRSRSLYSLGK